MSAGNELVDVIDDAGRTVAVTTRREMRVGRLPHRCVYVLVFNRRGEVFLHRRTPTKDVYPSYWDVTIGGVLSAGEGFDDGARREAAEELGVAVELESLFPFRFENAASSVQAMVYRAVHDGPFQLQPEEVLCGEFVPVEEIAVRAARLPFCPDGLQVWETFRRLPLPE